MKTRADVAAWWNSLTFHERSAIITDHHTYIRNPPRFNDLNPIETERAVRRYAEMMHLTLESFNG